MTGDNRYLALILGTAIVLLVGIPGNFSAFKLFNDTGNDFLARVYPHNYRVSDSLITVEAAHDFALRGDDVWLPALQSLLGNGAKQVVFTFLPPHASSVFYQLAASSGKVIFGQRLDTDNETQQAFLQSLPQGAVGKKLSLGLVQPPPIDKGVYRQQYSTIDFNGVTFPSLESLAAEKMLPAAKKVPKPYFEINFIGGTARLPRIELDRILAGGLISELVLGRTVILGVQGLSPIPYYFTPISADKGLISDVLFHAFALDTLLSDIVIRPAPYWINWILLVAITASGIVLYQWLARRNALWVLLIFSLGYLLAGWASLYWLSVTLPITEMLLVQWLTYAAVWRYRVLSENQALHAMLAKVAGNVHDKIFPESVYHIEDPWQQLAVMVTQTLQLEKMVFLERVAGEPRLTEIKAFNCTFKDIEERRRDYNRYPYSVAITENRPILLDKAYLRNSADESDTNQYLAPLIFAGELLGAWCFSVKNDVAGTSPQSKTIALAHSYMQQISEILHNRWEYQLRQESNQRSFWRYLRLAGGRLSYQQFNKPLTLLERRIACLQEIFNHQQNSSIIYDLFGRVLLVNQPMEALAQVNNLKPYNMTMVEFLVALTGFAIVEAKRILQQIIFDHESLILPVTGIDKERRWVLHIKPLDASASNPQHNVLFDEISVFDVSGILFELVDITQLKNLSELKVLMFERFNYQMRNDMASVFFALFVLNDANASADDKAFALRIIQEKIDETLTTLQTVQEQMHLEIEDLSADALVCYPVDGRSALQKVVADLKEQASARHINFHVNLPELMSLVFASPRELEGVIATIVQRMIDDAYEFGDIWIDVEEVEKHVYYRIRNNGPGMPENNLQHWLANAESDSLNAIKLQHVMRCVKHWGGTLDLTSALGEGSTVELSLRSFM